MSRRLCLVLAGSLILTGCNMATQQEAQFDDSRNPFYKQAEQELDNNNPAAAVQDYEKALAANPKLAGAHYQMGVIYGDKLSDPVSSIYHLKRYLALMPNSDKADQVKAMIDKQSTAFATSLPNSPAQSADDFSKLQADNASLKKQVEDATHTITELQSQLATAAKEKAAALAAATAPAPATTTPADGASSTTPAVAALPPINTNAITMPSAPPRALPLDATNATPLLGGVAPEAARSYKIVSGDSLWKIAHKMYPGDVKDGIEKIKDANKDILIEGKPLKIGQVLVIP